MNITLYMLYNCYIMLYMLYNRYITYITVICPSLVIDQSEISHRSVNVATGSYGALCKSKIGSRFSSYGQKAIAEAKKNDSLVEFAKNYPSPKERKALLANKVSAKNKNIWVRLVFREAYGIEGKDLGPEWAKFLERLNGV